MRLFVAVRPPPDVLKALVALPRADPSAVRWTTRDQWHVTLRFFGNVDDPAAIGAALSSVATSVVAPEVTMGPRAGVLGHQVVYLPVSGLDALSSAVVAATAHFGDAPPTRRFRGHLTLGRTRGGSVDTAALGCEALWTVHELELIRSHLGGGPARYETVERYALRGLRRV